MPLLTDPGALRGLLFAPLIDGTHVSISERFIELGIVETDDNATTKADRVRAVLASLGDDELVRVAKQVLDTGRVDAAVRNQIQDVLWADLRPSILERTRRNIAAVLYIDDLVGDAGRFESVLDRWWVLGTPNPFGGLFSSQVTDEPTYLDPFVASTDRLRKEIQRHVIRNQDWSTAELFDRIGAFTAVDRRFAGFIEDLVSHAVLVDEQVQRRVVSSMAAPLKEAQLELREVGSEGGYPVFELVSVGLPASRPKNVIFGSSRKPDLRLSNSIDNEIEIVNDDADVLVFDDPIDPATGLRWLDLQDWWTRQHWAPEGDPKVTLYRRLRDCIPAESPPQLRLFDLYHRIHGNRSVHLPALLPEVWLHWDHQTIRQRGVQALLGQRMDFLMLGPHHVRIVLEVDGITHYTNPKGEPSPPTYARQAQLDRQLRLRSYDVYRFGGVELQDDSTAVPMLTEFFEALFERHGIDA